MKNTQLTNTKRVIEELFLRRRQLKMSQGELGSMLGISHAAVSDMERGKTQIDLDRLNRWASCLKLRVEIKLLIDIPNE